jgi:hypothetical protein
MRQGSKMSPEVVRSELHVLLASPLPISTGGRVIRCQHMDDDIQCRFDATRRVLVASGDPPDPDQSGFARTIYMVQVCKEHDPDPGSRCRYRALLVPCRLDSVQGGRGRREAAVHLEPRGTGSNDPEPGRDSFAEGLNVFVARTQGSTFQRLAENVSGVPPEQSLVAAHHVGGAAR